MLIIYDELNPERLREGGIASLEAENTLHDRRAGFLRD